MEAIGAAASVIAIVEIVGRVSASAASFMRDIKDARKDMIQVRKDMSDLSTVLRMVAEDLDHHGHDSSSRAGAMPHSQQHIVGIAHSCGAVLLEIEAVLREGRSRYAWVTSGRERVDRLRARLETCKLLLDVALDYRTMVVVHGIKEDSTRIVGDLSAIQRDVALLLGKVDNIERKATGAQGSLDDAAFPGGVMLDRFLNECRSDVQTVLDSIEYQRDQDFEDVAPLVVQTNSPGCKPELTSFSPASTVLLKDSQGHVHEIPLEQCRTWADMEEMIKCSYAHGPADAEQLNRGRFTLYQPAQAVSPASWDDFVAGVRSVALEVVSDTIKFKDAVGRKFLFPWNLVNTRERMEDLVKQLFSNVEVVGPRVEQGCYDLLGPDNAIIAGIEWERVIKPGMRIDMRMWPSDGHRAMLRTRDTRPGHGASPQEQRPPACASQPPMGRDRPLSPSAPPASQQVRQKKDTSQGSSNPKKTQRSPATPHAPRPVVVKDRLVTSQPLGGSSHSRNARQNPT